MSKIELTQTNRGFAVAPFTDRYGAHCSLQKSSLATEDAIWFGVGQTREGVDVKDGRMHLSRSQVADLLPLLQRFVETGELYEGAPLVDAYSIIKGERTYQDEFAPDGEWEEHGEHKLLLLMEHYLGRARTDLCCPQMAEGAAGSSVRKVGALAVRYIETHGAPARARKAGEPRENQDG